MNPRSCKINLPDADIVYYPDFLDKDKSNQLFQKLHSTVEWTQRELTIFGQRKLMPRLIAWYADPDIEYRYSGGTTPHNHWIPELVNLKNAMELLCGTPFNGALLNLYRDGTDSMSWHSDDEKALGHNPVIASVSLGAQRQLKFRHRNNKHLKPHKLLLDSGSVLVMRGATQHFWQHQLPKTSKVITARINITFRFIHI